MEEKNIITFIDQNNHPVDYEILDIQEYNGNIYCVCYLADNSSTEVYIFRVEEVDNMHDRYVLETDDQITQAVFESFKNRNKDNFKFS